MRMFEQLLNCNYELEGIGNFIREDHGRESIKQPLPRLTKAKHTSVSVLDFMLFCITNGSLVELFP